MLVDPNTGLPIDPGPEPIAVDIADSMPGMILTTGWNANRVSNTILGGGTGLRRSMRRGGYSGGKGGLFSFTGGGIHQTFGPRHFSRLTRPANIDPTWHGTNSKIYTPFNALASLGNAASRRAMKSGRIAPAISRYGFEEGAAAFTPGTVGRLGAISRIAHMSDERYLGGGRRAGWANVARAIGDIHPQYYNNTFLPGMRAASAGVMGAPLTGAEHRAMTAAGLAATTGGTVSGRMSGYVAGASSAFLETKGATSAVAAGRGLLAEGTAARIGYDAGAKALASGSKFAKFVGSGNAAKVARGANIASVILIAHDVAEVIGKMAGRGINAMADAGKSAMGSINKPVMGMGFKDNTVAATARQRGVQAIANSRLNMRSYLGSEASSMYAHFG